MPKCNTIHFYYHHHHDFFFIEKKKIGYEPDSEWVFSG